MTSDEFAERLRDLVGEAEDAGLHGPEMIAELEDRSGAATVKRPATSDRNRRDRLEISGR